MKIFTRQIHAHIMMHGVSLFKWPKTVKHHNLMVIDSGLITFYTPDLNLINTFVTYYILVISIMLITG